MGPVSSGTGIGSGGGGAISSVDGGGNGTTGAVILATNSTPSLSINTGSRKISISGNVSSSRSLSSLSLTSSNVENSVAGAISGGSNFSFNGSGGGLIVLGSADNSYTGTTTVKQGILSISSLANGGINSGIGKSSSDAGNLILDGGTLNYTGVDVVTDRLFTLTPLGGTINVSNSGSLNFTNTGNVAFSGSGARRLVFNDDYLGISSFASILGNGTGGATSLTKAGSGSLTLSGNNTYVGATTVTSGTLTAGVATVGTSSGAFGVGSNITVNGGTLALGSYNESVGTVTIGANGGSITGSGGILTATTSYTLNNDSGHTASITAILAGSGVTLTQAGAGTTTLTGVNTYTGATTISAGTLKLANTSGTTLPTTAAIRMTGSSGSAATLDLAGYSQAFSSIAGSNSYNTITNSGSSDVVLTIDGATPGSFAGVIQNGATKKVGLTLNSSSSGTLTFSGTNSYTGTTTISAGTLTLTNALSSSTGVVMTGTSIWDLQATQTIASLSMATGNSITRSAGTSQ